MKTSVSVLFLLVCSVLMCVFEPACAADSPEDHEAEVEWLLVESYVSSHDFEAAASRCRQILEKDPSNLKARVRLADLLSWTNKFAESAGEYEKALAAAPGDRDIMKKLAKVSSWNKDFVRAEKIYRELVASDPNDAESWALLGQILSWQKKNAEAEECLKKALALKPDGNVRLDYGLSLLYLSDYDGAEKAFKTVLEADPRNNAAKVALADTYAYSKRFQKAIDLYREALGEKYDRLTKEKLADVLSWDKKYRESAALYDELLKEKEDPKVRRQKARMLGWARDYEGALKEYEKITDTGTNGVYRLEMDAKKAYWNKRVKTSISGYKELIAADNENVEGMFDLSQIYSYQSMWDDAIKEYDRILAASPGHFRAKEGKEKAELISSHPAIETGYEFYEADSTSRDTDICKHTFTTKLLTPVTRKLSIESVYGLTGRSFSDFHDIVENAADFKATYISNPAWWASAHYGFIGYNRDVAEFSHLFGGNVNFRVMDAGIFSVNYDRDRLENSSTVIREHYHKDDLTERLDIDVTNRLKIGADYLSSWYSDGNTRNEPGCDLLYYFSLEPMAFFAKYRYSYREFRNKVSEYFSPKGFSTNTLTLDWRHFLNKEEIFFGANDLYYDVKYDLTVDSEYIVGNKISWELNWDVTKRLNLNVKGSVSGSSANVYRESRLEAGMRYYF